MSRPIQASEISAISEQPQVPLVDPRPLEDRRDGGERQGGHRSSEAGEHSSGGEEQGHRDRPDEVEDRRSRLRAAGDRDADRDHEEVADDEERRRHERPMPRGGDPQHPEHVDRRGDGDDPDRRVEWIAGDELEAEKEGDRKRARDRDVEHLPLPVRPNGVALAGFVGGTPLAVLRVDCDELGQGRLSSAGSRARSWSCACLRPPRDPSAAAG